MRKDALGIVQIVKIGQLVDMQNEKGVAVHTFYSFQ